MVDSTTESAGLCGTFSTGIIDSPQRLAPALAQASTKLTPLASSGEYQCLSCHGVHLRANNALHADVAGCTKKRLLLSGSQKVDSVLRQSRVLVCLNL